MGELLKKWGETWAQTCQVVQSPCKPALVARGLVPPPPGVELLWQAGKQASGVDLADRAIELAVRQSCDLYVDPHRGTGRKGFSALSPSYLRMTVSVLSNMSILFNSDLN